MPILVEPNCSKESIFAVLGKNYLEGYPAFLIRIYVKLYHLVPIQG